MLDLLSGDSYLAWLGEKLESSLVVLYVGVHSNVRIVQVFESHLLLTSALYHSEVLRGIESQL